MDDAPVGEDHHIGTIGGRDGKDGVAVAREILEQRRVLRREVAQSWLEDEHGVARCTGGEWGTIAAVGLDGVATLRELLSDEAMLLVAQLPPLLWQIGRGLRTGHAHSRIPGPDDELAVRSRVWREEITP